MNKLTCTSVEYIFKVSNDKKEIYIQRCYVIETCEKLKDALQKVFLIGFIQKIIKLL